MRRGNPLSVRTSHTGAEMTDAPLERREGGREQKVGGYERKSKEENHENKNETQDCMEAERDEELKSIDLLFLSFNIFQEFFSRPTVQTFYVV